MTWSEIVRHLERAGLIVSVKQIDDTTHEATAKVAWNAVAREMARVVPRGQFMPLGEGGVKWQIGSSTGGVIVLVGMGRGIRRAQDIARAVTGARISEPLPWSVGGCARHILRWSGVETPCHPSAELLRYRREEEDAEYQYDDCQPGEYDRLTMYDLSQCYYSLLSRLPTPNVMLTKRGLLWRALPDAQAKRWGEALEAIGSDKLLANSVWGVMLGGTHWSKPVGKAGYREVRGGVKKAWTSAPGKRDGLRQVEIFLPPGPLRTPAILVCRTASEVCSIASEEVDSVYSTVDSVTTRGEGRPAVWDKYGLSYKVHARGDRERDGFPSHIVAKRVWRIGPRHTAPYALAVGKAVPITKEFRCPTKPEPVPRYRFDTLYHRQWL